MIMDVETARTAGEIGAIAVTPVDVPAMGTFLRGASGAYEDYLFADDFGTLVKLSHRVEKLRSILLGYFGA